MKYLLILPVALLVTFGQLLVKWRAAQLPRIAGTAGEELRGFAHFVADPVNLLAYGAGFVANLAWLYLLTKLPLTTAFPVYMGATFMMILLGGWLALGEQLTPMKLVAVFLILAGMFLAVRADA